MLVDVRRAIEARPEMPPGEEPPQGDEFVLTGPVTLYEVAAVRDRLRSALAAGNPLFLDLGDSGPWDIAGLQLLISCVRAGRQQGLDVRMIHVPPACDDLARRYGLSDWLHSVGT